MASSELVTCPKCGGKAHWNADDNITYCNEPNCGFFDVEDKNNSYSPPYYRGGSNQTRGM